MLHLALVNAQDVCVAVVVHAPEELFLILNGR